LKETEKISDYTDFENMITQIRKCYLIFV
jgi:hypothetical protein